MNYGERKITHIRLYLNRIEQFRAALNNEQMGRLVFAVADYVKTGERESVDGDIVIPYSEMCYALDKLKRGWAGE